MGADKMEDKIARKRELHETGRKVSSFASDAYNKFKDNGGKVGKFLESFERELGYSTQNVNNALDEMSKALTNFVYDKDKGLYTLMDTMSMVSFCVLPVRFLSVTT